MPEFIPGGSRRLIFLAATNCNLVTRHRPYSMFLDLCWAGTCGKGTYCPTPCLWLTGVWNQGRIIVYRYGEIIDSLIRILGKQSKNKVMADIFPFLNSVTHLFLRFILTEKLFFSTFGSNFPSRPHLTPAPGALLQVSICLSAVFLRPTPSKDQKETPCPLLLQRWPLWNRDDGNQWSHWRIKGFTPALFTTSQAHCENSPPTQVSLSFFLTTISLPHHISSLLQY